MKTGEKISFLRKKKGYTQEHMAEILEVSRQSVSRWEIDMAFPETEKLIKLSRLLECSIDYLLDDKDIDENDFQCEPSVSDAYRMIKECGYFFLATDSGGFPNQRPMGMIVCTNNMLYFGTDRRKQLFAELMENSKISIVSYNLQNRRWVRILGEAMEETSIDICDSMKDSFPMLKQKYTPEEEIYFVTMKIIISLIEIN